MLVSTPRRSVLAAIKPYSASRCARHSASEAARPLSACSPCGNITFLEPRLPNVPSSPVFSRAVKANGLVFVSGTGAGNDIGGPAREGTARKETRWALENVAKILDEAGSSMDHVVNMTMLLTAKEDYDECNAEYAAHFQNGKLPSRTTQLWGVPTTAKVAFSCIALMR
eukprot:CAMPEP_0117475582 /NCGR_PEP_ID=MMETSP0784-20121206/9869_1 /TAXON_ID=39447 /ORGANISM="" /LENGTH=168 /DNA_ID=CAMNT_0005269833 /DNA_START=65 /DNA_END=571 /DNA_ORIENTATION=-